MWEDLNVYYTPSAFNLSVFGTLSQPGLSYEFNMLVVWEDPETGELYYAHDSGCSCPTPFERLVRESLAPLADNESAWKAFRLACQSTMPYDWHDGSTSSSLAGKWNADRADLEAKIIKHFRARKERPLFGPLPDLEA